MIIRIFEKNDGVHDYNIIYATVEDNEQFNTKYAEVINEDSFRSNDYKKGVRQVHAIFIDNNDLQVIKPSYEEISSGYFSEIALIECITMKIKVINSYNQSLRGNDAVTKVLIERKDNQPIK